MEMPSSLQLCALYALESDVGCSICTIKQTFDMLYATVLGKGWAWWSACYQVGLCACSKWSKSHVGTSFGGWQIPFFYMVNKFYVGVSLFIHRSGNFPSFWQIDQLLTPLKGAKELHERCRGMEMMKHQLCFDSLFEIAHRLILLSI
jgi:hypothetical protein